MADRLPSISTRLAYQVAPALVIGYFQQFGKVKAVRVSRSKRTARSRGYAFVRFDDAEVAAIAAKAMDGYMMFS